MEKLNERAEALRGRLAEYQRLLSGKLEDPTMMYLGDSYFTSMPLTESKAFLSRRIESLRSELAALDQLSGVSEDGLPIFDIVEELDEDGQVLHSNLKRTGLGAEHDGFANSKIALHVRDEKEPINGEHKSLGDVAGADNAFARDNGKTFNPSPAVHAAVEREFEHVESSGPESFHADDIQYIEDITASDVGPEASASEDTSQGEYRDIDPADVLELELLEDSDDGNVQFDFDHIEEEDEDHVDAPSDNSDAHSSDDFDDDDDEDDDDESFAFGWQGGALFPQDEATIKLIQAHLSQQSQAPTAAGASSKQEPAAASEASNPTTDKPAPKSHVHFSDTVDVREFETSSSERKGVIYDRKPSRFSLARNRARTVSPKADAGVPSVSQSPPKAKSAAAAAAAAAGAAASGTQNTSPARHGHTVSPAHGAVRERVSAVSHPVPSPTANRRRGVPSPAAAAAIAKPSPATPAAPKSSVFKQTAPQAAHSHASEKPPSKSQEKAEQRKQTHKPMLPPETGTPRVEAPPSRSKKEIVADRAQEYYEESFIPDVDFLKLHDTEETTTTAPGHDAHESPVKPVKQASRAGTAPDKEKPLKEDRPVVSPVVMEREPEDAVDDSADDSDNTPDMREIKHEYQRLRQKLIYESGGFKKKDAEKAVEPIEENGAPKKVSRFKAARVAS